MDFLDPKLQRRHNVQLMIGYVFVAIAIVFATLVLLYQAYGFGIGKNGQVVQKGLVFVSSHPAGATISLSNTSVSAQTDTRLSLVSGTYQMSVTKNGYRAWQRDITVVGGAVSHYDYPFLFPTSLTTSSVASYSSAPAVVTQTPDQRWLLVEQPTVSTNVTFDEYDLQNPKTAAVQIVLPTADYTAGTTNSWQAVEWSNDNRHLLLEHTYDTKTEFVMLDRDDPTQSVNLNTTLGETPTSIDLVNQKYDQYYVYTASTQALQTASISNPTPVAFLSNVLAYKSYGSNDLLYASSASSGTGKVSIDLYQSGKTYALREVASGSNYLLDLTQYSGSWYVAVGASSEGKVYIYKNPVTQLDSVLGTLVPIYVLRNPNPTYLAFSASAQFIMDESGAQFAVYDVMNDNAYAYNTKAPVDSPQIHATWMDGDRLIYISGGKLLVFDYDHANPQTLMSTNPAYTPFFSGDYSFVDAMSPAQASGQVSLTSTPLLTPTDQ